MKNVKKITILSAIACLLLSGCGVGIGMSNEDMNVESSVGIFQEEAKSMEAESVREGLEETKDIEDIESFSIDEMEDNWPESIHYSGDGVYASPMSVNFEVDEPMTLSVSCETRDGELRVKIVDDDSFKETVYFDETDPDGTYTVDLDKKGTYQLLIYAKYHVGRVEVTPLKE